MIGAKWRVGSARIPAVLALWLAWPGGLEARQAAPGGTARPGDWRIEAPSRIRFGRVSLVHDPAGARLDIYSLRDAVPSAPADAVRSESPDPAGDVLRVADFDAGVRNRLGGFANVFQRAPSSGSAGNARGPDGRPGLRVECRNDAGGFCGAWVHLFDFTKPASSRRFLDASPFAVLSFWIRGEAGGERVLLKLADAAWERREDAVPVGDIGGLLAAGRIDREWQRAEIPLRALPGRLDPRSLATLVFEAMSPGDSRFWVTGISFSRSAGTLADLPRAQSTGTPERPAARATWVWHTAELIRDAAARDELIGFLRAERFDVVFLQLPDSAGGTRLPGEIVPDGAGLRPVVGALQAAGIRVYALDGYKRYALREYHEGVLRTIDHVARYNEAVPPAERFDGIRHDIEPYIMPGFDGPQREPILVQFLEIAARSAERARAAGLHYGVDIPFWYDAPDPDTGEPALVTFRGTRRPASEHIIDIADDVAILDYRTSAWGADGTIRHAEGELGYAASAGKPVLVGLETAPLADEELIDFAGEPVTDPGSIDEARGAIVLSSLAADSVRIAFVAADLLGDADALGAALQQAGVDASHALWWPVRSRTPVPADRLSFARRGESALQRTMEETVLGLSASPAFAGFAIHEARTYRALVGR